jgi:hypothetical protein
MSFKVMNPNGGQIQTLGQGFSKRASHEQGSREAGPLGKGNGINISQFEARLG